MPRPSADDGDELARLVTLASTELEPALVADIRSLMAAAFGDDPDDRFEDADWEHALGGRHVLLVAARTVIGHAAVVPRRLWIAGQAVATGYVEAVAVRPDAQGRGHGSHLMTAVGEHIRSAYELGALGTGRHAFYERLGWRTWQGPTSVRTADRERRTPDEDGYVLVLPTPTTPIAPLDLGAPIACEWRPGDVW